MQHGELTNREGITCFTNFAPFRFLNYLSRLFSRRCEKCAVQLLDHLTLEQSKSEKCDMLSSLILLAIKIWEQICCHLIPKMHVSNGYVYVPKTTPSI